MSTQAIILTGVLVYLVIMLIVGVYAARQSDTAENFMVAGRRMPLWICSATLVATWSGCWQLCSCRTWLVICWDWSHAS